MTEAISKMMRRKIHIVLILALSLVWLVLPQVTQAAQTSQITQFGITWTFDKEYEYGQFVNGDYWVVGPVTIVEIDPAPIRSDTDGRNGTVINPRFATEQGYDARATAYKVSLCTSPPFAVSPGDSVISTVSLPEPVGKGIYIKTAAVLTIVDVPQTSDKFRPPYTRPTRVASTSQDNLLFSTNDIQWHLLSQLEPVSNTPALSDTESKFEKLRLEHYQGWTAYEIYPVDSGSHYGREVSRNVSEVSLQLHLNYTNEEKKKLLVRFMQYGIDLYGIYLDGGEWHADGGIFCGRKWPLLFTGIMLNNEIKDIEMNPERFHEDGQTFYVTQHPAGDQAPPGNTDYDIYVPPYHLHQYGWSGNNYETGTVKVTHGNTIVEGLGTSWANSPKVGAGYSFGVHNDTEAYKTDGKAYVIDRVIDDTHLALTEPYRGNTDTSGNATYMINPKRVVYGHGNGGKNIDYIEYTAEHKGLPEWGIKHIRDRNFDGLNWKAPYRICCNATAWSGFILAALIMEEKASAKTLWDHDALFDYQDRYMEVEKHIDGVGHWRRSWNRFVEKMWDTYRADYGPVWTMSPTLTITAVNGSVIKTPDKPAYKLGEIVTLEAVPDAGYQFVGWSGDLLDTGNPGTIPMHANQSITANFNKPPDISAIPDTLTKNEGETIEASEIELATDHDGHTLTYTYSGWLTSLPYDINYDDAGTHILHVDVSNGVNPPVGKDITITINDSDFADQPELKCYNNVFNPTKGEEALIIVNLPKQAHVKLGVYDIKGNRIKELADEEEEAGTPKYHWDGKNDSGNVVGSGLYFVHIQAGDFKKTKKIVVIK